VYDAFRIFISFLDYNCNGERTRQEIPKASRISRKTVVNKRLTNTPSHAYTDVEEIFVFKFGWREPKAVTPLPFLRFVLSETLL